MITTASSAFFTRMQWTVMFARVVAVVVLLVVAVNGARYTRTVTYDGEIVVRWYVLIAEPRLFYKLFSVQQQGGSWSC